MSSSTQEVIREEMVISQPTSFFRLDRSFINKAQYLDELYFYNAVNYVFVKQIKTSVSTKYCTNSYIG